jgi:hypothetical protein
MTKSGLEYKKTLVLQGSDFLFLEMAEVGINILYSIIHKKTSKGTLLCTL